MDQVLLGRDLPNLRIAVDNVESMQEDNAMDVDDERDSVTNNATDDDHSATDDQKVEKLDDNKPKNLILGLNLSSKEMMKKLEDRAKRFGVEGWPKRSITEADVDMLYKSLDIDEKCVLSSGGSKGIRLEAIHVRGVNEMSTEDIFEYFKDYGPASVEWINDFSCNVIWLERTGTAHALLGLSRPVLVRAKKTSADGKPIHESLQETEINEGAEEVVIMSDDDDDDIDATTNEASPPEKPDTMSESPLESEQKSENATKDEDKEGKDGVEVLEMELPMPPGHWRLGVPHARAKALLLRFATRQDKKMPGAEKHSLYYQKYGNPNYGGIKGLISTSKKRRFRQSQQQDFSTLLSDADAVKPAAKPPQRDSDSDDSNADMRRRDKRPRMRMYADEEEEKQKRKREKAASKARSIHRRLGRAPERRRQDVGLSEDDDEWNEGSDTELRRDFSRTIERGGGGRANVWQRLSERSPLRVSSDDDDINSENSDSAGRVWTRTGSRQTDLRHKLDLGQKQSVSQSALAGGRDLRGKLDQLRKEKELQKHRSPLLIQVTNVNSS